MEKFEAEDKLKVFLEPADWDEELRGPRPIIQLDVSTQSYIAEKATSGPSAIERSNLPCMCHRPQFLKSTPANHICDAGTVLWSVSKPAFDSRIIRGNLADARGRAFFPYNLPTGVNLRDMEKVWQELQFNPAAPVDVPFEAEMFRPAPRSAQVLRQLAQKGQIYLDRIAREQGGRDKFVLGLPNDAREMAPLIAHAHGDPSDSGPLSAPSIGEGSTTATSLPTEPQNFEGTKESVTSSTTDQEQEWARRGDAVPPMMTAPRTAGPATVGEQADDQLFQTVPPLPGTNAGSGDFVSESTVVHLEEMLSEDQRRIVGDSAAGGQMTAAVRPRPASHIHPRTERNSKSLELIKDLERSLRDADEIG